MCLCRWSTAGDDLIYRAEFGRSGKVFLGPLVWVVSPSKESSEGTIASSGSVDKPRFKGGTVEIIGLAQAHLVVLSVIPPTLKRGRFPQSNVRARPVDLDGEEPA